MISVMLRILMSSLKDHGEIKGSKVTRIMLCTAFTMYIQWHPMAQEEI
jgi:hypothetical protein